MKSSILSRRPVSSGIVATISVWLGAALIFLLAVQLSGNFHTVIAGELYRSAQPTASELENYIQEHGIKTVINLRGQNERDWYDQETAVTQRLGVQHLDFKMSSSRILTAERADQLVALMKAAPKPILLHCLSGSDRTGIASALYSQQIAGMDASIAERQLSFYYGHIAIPYLSSAYAMDESWEKLSKHFNKDLVHAPAAMPAPSDKPSDVLMATARNDDGLDR